MDLLTRELQGFAANWAAGPGQLEAALRGEGFRSIEEEALLQWCLRVEQIKELQDLLDPATRELLMKRNRRIYAAPPAGDDFLLRLLRPELERACAFEGIPFRPEILPPFAETRLAECPEFGNLRSDVSALAPSVSLLLASDRPEPFHPVLAWARRRALRLEESLARKAWTRPEFKRKIVWSLADDDWFPWQAMVDGQVWKVRLNDFPDDVPFSLYVDGADRGAFVAWPRPWQRPGTLPLDIPAKTSPAKARRGAATNWLARYEAGEHERVWEDLRALGESVADVELHLDALAVARATVARVRRNLEVITEELSTAGYRFGVPDLPFPVLSGPDEQAREILSDLEGSLPLLLVAWYESLGSVNLSGQHDLLAPSAVSMWDENAELPLPDPLVILPLPVAWEDGNVLRLSVSADLKAGRMGEPALLAVLPQRGADCVVDDGVSLLAYLRNSFRSGGFPGCPAELQALVPGLGQRMLPF